MYKVGQTVKQTTTGWGRRTATPASYDWRDADPSYRGNSRLDVGEPGELQGTQLLGRRGRSRPAEDADNHGHRRDAGPRSPAPEQHRQVPALRGFVTAARNIVTLPSRVSCHRGIGGEGCLQEGRQRTPPRPAADPAPNPRPAARAGLARATEGGGGWAAGEGDRKVCAAALGGVAPTPELEDLGTRG